jgi:hypothetical protein
LQKAKLNLFNWAKTPVVNIIRKFTLVLKQKRTKFVPFVDINFGYLLRGKQKQKYGIGFCYS